MDTQLEIIQILKASGFFAPLVFIILRSISVIIPPVSGLLFDIAGILVFGWVGGLIYGQIGTMLGSIVAFLIARKFREPAVAKFVALQKLHEWEDRYSEKKKFWSLIVIRFLTSPFFDYVSYAAGLTKMRFFVFFLTTLIGTFPLMFVTYYFGGKFLNMSWAVAIAFVIIVVTIGYAFRLWSKKRYLEK